MLIRTSLSSPFLKKSFLSTSEIFLNLPSMSFIPDLNDLNFLIHCCIDEYFFREVISELKAAGASWIQFDEPTIVLDLDSHKLKAFTDAYSEL